MADKPKRPLSAYMLWLNSARESIKRENPDFKVTEVAKKGGELWRGLKDKSEWEAKAATAKQNYIRALQEYERNGGGGDDKGKKRKGAAPKKGAGKKSKKGAHSDDDGDSE
uniref:Mobility group protein 1B n=1 Tax=Chironomus tentans TaxID=7153 RepID=HMG1B_CHITE|nr:RecName: Full=Mobility group protein 1B [Chironomus tentans]AAA21713.1 high mobility group protein 1b [Chironomus tentans]